MAIKDQFADFCQTVWACNIFLNAWHFSFRRGFIMHLLVVDSLNWF